MNTALAVICFALCVAFGGIVGMVALLLDAARRQAKQQAQALLEEVLIQRQMLADLERVIVCERLMPPRP